MARKVAPKEPDKLTLKQRLFVEAYLGETRGNATEAARIAGYKGNDVTLGQVGAENLKKPQIEKLLSSRVEEAAMSADEVLKLLSDHARASLADFLTFPENGRAPFVDLEKAQRLGKLHLVKKIDTHELTGTVKSIQLHDSQSALALLGKHHRLFIDEQKHSGELEIIVKREQRTGTTKTD